MAGPLAGVKVLEFSEIIAAPFAGMLLADMGADVLKVEPPWGEPWRSFQQFTPGESRAYISLNRGKRSLPLDLTKREAREIVHKLVPQMDVVLVNYRPDVPAKLGIDYDTLHALNSRLVYCENTAFGRRGRHSRRPGYDLIIQAMTGLMAANRKLLNGIPQQVIATAVADFSTGLTITWAVCAALYARERTGLGQKIEATLLGTSLGIQTSRFLQVTRHDRELWQGFLEELSHLRAAGCTYEELHALYEAKRPQLPQGEVGNIYYRPYQSRDGVLVVGCLSDPLRLKLMSLLGLDDIRFQPGYDPQSQEARAFGDELIKKAEAVFQGKTTGEWIRTLDAAGIPCGPVRFTEELMEDDQVLANDLVVEVEHATLGPVRMVGPLVSMSETPLEARRASPTLGQHTGEVLASLGYSPADIQRLRDQGVTR